MYRAITRKIEVVVKPRFVADRSSPENNYFFWAYTISITNNNNDYCCYEKTDSLTFA